MASESLRTADLAVAHPNSPCAGFWDWDLGQGCPILSTALRTFLKRAHDPEDRSRNS